MRSIALTAATAVIFVTLGCGKPRPAQGRPPVWTPPPSGQPSGPVAPLHAGQAEQLTLSDGVPATSSSGLSLTITKTIFEGGEPPRPGISTPAIAITRVIVAATFGGKHTELYFTMPSPGVASNTHEEWEGLGIDLLDRTLQDGTWVTRFAVQRLAR